MKYNLILLFSFFLAFQACKKDTASTSTAPETTRPEVKKTKYTLTPFSPSTSYQGAAIKDMKYKAGTFNFSIGGSQYKLGQQTPDAPQKMCANSAKGQHIHLIVDNAPYAAKYEPTFKHEIEDGEHYVLAFLSRSYHESIKTMKAHRAIKVTAENNSFTASADIEKPMLFYSRPKGTYVGKKDTEKVMLDFYPVNARLGEKYRVKATINGEEHILDKWQPYYITGLPMGKNTITLTLINAEGNPVETPLNPVTREFELKADPLENPQ